MLSHDFARALLQAPNVPIYGADSGREIELDGSPIGVSPIVDTDHPDYVPFLESEHGKPFAGQEAGRERSERQIAVVAWMATQPKKDSIWIH